MVSVPTIKQGTAQARYERLKSVRQTFLDRARKCSELTIPTLIPPEGRNNTTTYYTPWQGVGARGVNNLAAKLLLSLFPPNSPFFKMEVDDYTKDKLAPDPKMRAKVDEGLSKYERAVQSEIEQSGMRSPSFTALKYIIVGGNAFVLLPADGGMRVFPLDSYVVDRDPSGNVLEAITNEKVSRETLDPAVQAALGEKVPQTNNAKTDTNIDEVDVYTRYWLKGKHWLSCQEIEGIKVPGSEGKWAKHAPPFMALRWTSIDGEDYGRSYVEEYLGDLIALEGLSKAIVEAAAISAKVIFLVKPNSTTRASDITEAENGDAVVGNKEDVDTLQVEKASDLRVAYEAVQTITERLSYAFLLNSAVQRKGERVTAEEIRYMASELEDALGGVYSILSQEFQLPLVIRIQDRQTRAGKLPPLPKGMVKPVIVTGLEALGRGHDAMKVTQTLTELRQAFGDAVLQYINAPEAISRVFAGRGIDTVGLVKTPEDIANEQAQAAAAARQQQMGELAGKAAPAAIKAMSDNAIAAGEQGQAEAAPQG